MKKINVTILASGKILSAYKKNEEYQSWIDSCIASEVWGKINDYTIDVIDATEELELKRQEKETATKIYVDNHINNKSNPHEISKEQVGLGNVDNVSAGELRDRSSHTGTQLASTISDFIESAQDAVGNALLNSSDINFSYPDIDNKITASLTDSGVISGSYSLVSVDSKGRVVSGSNNSSTVTKFSYFTSSTTSRAGQTFITVQGLVTDSLPIGLYAIRFFGRLQSGGNTNGTGLRLNVETAEVSTCNINWFIDQGTNGTQQTYQYSQLDTSINITSASPPSANTTFNAQARGVVRIISPGSLKVEIRSELNNTSSSILADSYITLELI